MREQVEPATNKFIYWVHNVSLTYIYKSIFGVIQNETKSVIKQYPIGLHRHLSQIENSDQALQIQTT